MKHLLPARYVLTMLLACFMALGAQADPIKFYVSAKTGNDSRTGTSWNDAFKTLKAALNHVEISANPEAIVYVAEGKYDVGEVNAITYKDGKKRDAFYVMTKPGQKLTIAGGYPTPGSSTLPKDTCSSNPRQYITEFTSDRMMRNSVLRANNSNQSLILRGLTFNSKKFIALPGQGAIITMDCNNFDNPYLELTDCVFNYYKSARHSAIFFYGTMKNPRVKINRVEVLQGEYVGGQGGGFLSFSDGGEKQTNVKVDVSYVTFHDIHHQGIYQGVDLFGLTNHGEDPTDTEGSYVRIDHMQVDRNTGGTAENQQSTISLNGFKNVTITNSTFRNSQARKGGVLRMMNCQNMYLENNQFYNNFSGDRGGAIYVSTPNGIYDILTSVPEGTQRYITIKDCEFDKNRAGATAAVGDGGSLLVDDTNEKSPLNVTVDNCNFKNGETTALEGAAMWVKVAGTVTVKNSMFCKNTTGTQGASGTGAGGAIRFAGAKTVLLEGCYFSDNASKKGGGAIELDIANSRFDVKNCVFANSTVTDGADGGGVIYPSGGAVSLSSGHGTFTNCKFINNKCNSYGGAVSIRNNQSNVTEPITFEKCEFVDNKANNGGAIGQINNGHPVIVKDCIFKKNHAYGVEKSGDGGGAIAMLIGCKGTQLIHNTFEGNTVVGKGGAVLALNAAFVKSSDNRYYNNEANQGGAICMNDAAIEDNTSGLWSTNDVFFGNVAKKGNLATNILTYTLPGSGGALSILLAQGKNCIIENSTFVKNTGDGIEGRLGSGGAIFYVTRTGLLTGDNRFVIDRLKKCTFFGNQGMSNDSKMSTTVWGADISSHQTGYSYIRIFDSKLQLASNMYKSKLRLDEQSGNTYSNNEDPGTSATATPIDGQGYTMPTSTEMGAQGEGVKIDCKPIVQRPEIDVLKPHANIITNDSKQPGVSKTFASYCANEKKYWAKFQSKGGEGPFTFTYDVWKQKGNSFEKIVTAKVAKTSTKKILIPEKKIPHYDYTKPIKNEKGDTIDYEINGYDIIPAHEEYPDSVILTGEELFPIAKVAEGYLYTIIVKSMTDHDGLTYKYDCSGEYNLTREYGQNVGAQIFFKDCTLPKEDIDWDNDGIINIDENPELNPTNFALQDNQLGTSKWVRYRPNVNTQKLFADIVKDENYLNATPKTGDKVKVLTLLPSVVGASSATGDPFTVDLSDKFGYAAGSGKVVVKIHNYKIDGDRFMTGSANKKNITTWEVSGTMHPYVLMQSTPASLFHIDNQFGINILTNEHAYSQTELYTKMDDDRYTVFESEGTKKVIVNNKDVNLKDMVGLSYLNVDPGTKYFAFTQTLDQTGEVNTLVTIMLPADDDKDGVPNFLDPDSDGDGCFDAIEGGDNVTEDMDMVDEQGQIKGKEDTDGVPVAVNPGNPADKDGKQGQSRGSAYDPEVNACGYNYWTGDVDNDFNKKENWTKDVPKDGENIIFADGSVNAKEKKAVRDLHLPAGKFISANKLVNNAPDEKIEEGANEKTKGHPAVVVPADGGLTVKSVEGFTTDGDKDKLVMKTSTDGKKVGTFILNNENSCNTTVFATVEFKPLGTYVQRRTATDDKDKTSPDYNQTVWNEFDWQYIGLPVKQTKKQTRSKDLYIRAYSEKLNDPNHYYRKWTDVPKGSEMKAFVGYEVAPVTDTGKGVHKIQGQLNLCEQTIELTRQAAVVNASTAEGDNAKRYGLGHNIVGNSFMAGVDIKNIQLESGENGVKMDNTVYIYTTGSWEDWKNAYGNSVKDKGGYEAVPIGVAGENGMPHTLAPMQGFMVKYKNPTYSTTLGKLTIPYKGVVKEGGELRAKRFNAETDYCDGGIAVKIDNEQVYDKFTMLQRQNATAAYDNGYDGEKLNMGEPSAFGTTTDAKNVQVMTVPSVIGSAFNVEICKGKTYNMELTAMDLDYQNLKLIDLKNETVTPFVDNKARYFFTGDVDGIEANRFVFVDTPETDFAKILGSVTGIENMTTTLTKGQAEVYDLSGVKIGTFKLPLSADDLKGKVPAGVYLVKATDGKTVETRKYVVE
ncbi:T9SS type A sorting domain-containing protein [Hallella colorans]|uniref:T9SS type A sorting domain-containing protein n=1 Tax=Hallella colorans TaxID=1703337 RepID=UPI00248D4EB4|nr:T9SS type A sorting domain-containing protein [Hallella colorans]